MKNTLTERKQIVLIVGMIMKSETPIQRAIRIAGGPDQLAKVLGKSVSRQRVINWALRKKVPDRWCLAIEQHTGVDRRELCDNWHDYWPELNESWREPGGILNKTVA